MAGCSPRAGCPGRRRIPIPPPAARRSGRAKGLKDSRTQGPRMKLALVTRRYPPLIGGAEKILSYLAAALAAEGAEVTVLTSRMPGLGLPAREDVPVDARAKSPGGRLTVERLSTSRLRFWGTWL